MRFHGRVPEHVIENDGTFSLHLIMVWKLHWSEPVMVTMAERQLLSAEKSVQRNMLKLTGGVHWSDAWWICSQLTLWWIAPTNTARMSCDSRQWQHWPQCQCQVKISIQDLEALQENKVNSKLIRSLIYLTIYSV